MKRNEGNEEPRSSGTLLTPATTWTESVPSDLSGKQEATKQGPDQGRDGR